MNLTPAFRSRLSAVVTIVTAVGVIGFAWSFVNPPQPTALETSLCTVPRAQAGVAVVPEGVRLCQALGPAAPYAIWAVDSMAGRGCGEVGWDARGCIPWQEFAQGEYV